MDDPEWACWAKAKTETTLKAMPELKLLKDRLLSLGGDWVALQPEPDLLWLLKDGCLMNGKVILKHMAPCKCHNNCALLWNKNPKTHKIATGWALSSDGIWRQHTWLIKGNVIIETTEPRIQYYGIMLDELDANQFWLQNHIF
jgi:hypothetical protein